MGTGSGNIGSSKATISLNMRPERRLIRQDGSFRHIDFHLRVEQAAGVASTRTPLTLALVLDRSGSMQGEKIRTAKRAALAVLERLDERDQAALVVFDDRIDVVQPVGSVDAAFKAKARAALALIEARANTALHEGWLTGCKSIASDSAPAQNDGVSRSFLLTDGLANVGVTDPEQIASEAAGIREHAGISTSTFGIGDDYNERLLGPMAVAGGGQFHHLRTAHEIANTFIGELGDLLAVSARQVKLEIEVDAGMLVDLTSAYWSQPDAGDTRRRTIAIGDLLSGEERHIVIRFGFPSQDDQEGHTVRARVLWLADGAERSSDWQEVRFVFADQHACDAEQRDQTVMHWVGLHHADRAHREAIEQSQSGDLPGAREKLRKVAIRIEEYAGEDSELRASLAELREMERQLNNAPLPSRVTKEAWYTHQTRSRGQKDHRGPGSA